VTAVLTMQIKVWMRSTSPSEVRGTDLAAKGFLAFSARQMASADISMTWDWRTWVSRTEPGISSKVTSDGIGKRTAV